MESSTGVGQRPCETPNLPKPQQPPSTSPSPTPFDSLPFEIFLHIIESYLSYGDLLRLSQTCRSMRAAFGNPDAFFTRAEKVDYYYEVENRHLQQHAAHLACYTCFRFLPADAFGDSMRRGPHGKFGADYRRKIGRFCWDCGVSDEDAGEKNDGEGGGGPKPGQSRLETLPTAVLEKLADTEARDKFNKFSSNVICRRCNLLRFPDENCRGCGDKFEEWNKPKQGKLWWETWLVSEPDSDGLFPCWWDEAAVTQSPGDPWEQGHGLCLDSLGFGGEEVPQENGDGSFKALSHNGEDQEDGALGIPR
ncbi:hypothetical protein P885DRAFT_59724 [Corynascus similis CBS 632.67]